MAIDFNEATTHDPNDKDAAKAQETRDLLAGIQGNILKGHGRDFTVHVFVRFDRANSYLRQSLRKFAHENVTSALQQHVETEQFKKYNIPGALFGNLFLTANGYRALGLDETQLQTAFTEPPESLFNTQSNFLDGMSKHGGEFNDPPANNWDNGYQSGDIDAMFLFADDDQQFLLRRSRDLINQLDGFCDILVVEQGAALRNKAKDGIEHFGYVDGRSQPIYLEGDLEAGEKIDKWDPTEPLRIVLTADKLAGANSWGSYFVFRKLEQNVLGFKTREIELADALNLTGDDRERAGAMVVGRFEDGTPLVLSQTDGFVPKKENNFNYTDADNDGLKCPFQAHIRKVNPRGDTVKHLGAPERGDSNSLFGERDRRITRRGIPYGTRSKPPQDAQALADYPTKNVGLLFMCFQSSIRNQFAFMQRAWVNNPDFVMPKTGIDPVIGQSAAGNAAPQNWKPEYGKDGAPTEFEFNGFVRLKGGEYFFAPSIAFLKTFAPTM